ncbi:MAG: YafY family transcriptional regulator [Spirochaetales bacterium]|nr:YafY family transcriptional regulator [Spirochaetales bacterium]
MKIDRLVSIVMILLDKERIGAQELADMFEVSRRTIYRDMDIINMAGIPVHSTSGAGGGFEIMQNYKVDRNVFSADDLSAILMGLSSLSGMIRGNDLVNALAKVRSFIPADKAKEIEVKAHHLYVDVSPWMGNRNIQPHLEIIKSALEESRLLSFEYADRYGNMTARTAEPYQLVLKGSHWYWYGYCRKRGDFRLFRLSRTSRLHIQEERFTPRDFQKPQLEFSEVLATLHTRINIRIHSSIMDRVLEYCGSENFLPDGAEHYFVSFPFIENDYYYNILFSFGDKCECLDPLHIRKEMKRRAQVIAAMYGS